MLSQDGTTDNANASSGSRRRLPGFWASKRIIARLERFQNVYRYWHGSAPAIQQAPPVSELFPDTDTRPTPEGLKQTLDRLLPMVHRDLVRAGIHTKITLAGTRYRQSEQNILVRVPETITTQYELPTNLFDTPVDRREKVYETMISMLDRGIGFYAQRRGDAFREMFNPLRWVASVLGIPVFVIQEAGLEHVSPTWLGNLYNWFARVVILAVLIFGLTKLGVSIPWSEILVALFPKMP